MRYLQDIHISVQMCGDIIRNVSGVTYEMSLEAPATILGLLALWEFLSYHRVSGTSYQTSSEVLVPCRVNNKHGIYNLSNFTTVLTPQLPVQH